MGVPRSGTRREEKPGASKRRVKGWDATARRVSTRPARDQPVTRPRGTTQQPRAALREKAHRVTTRVIGARGANVVRRDLRSRRIKPRANRPQRASRFLIVVSSGRKSRRCATTLRARQVMRCAQVSKARLVIPRVKLRRVRRARPPRAPTLRARAQRATAQHETTLRARAQRETTLRARAQRETTLRARAQRETTLRAAAQHETTLRATAQHETAQPRVKARSADNLGAKSTHLRARRSTNLTLTDVWSRNAPLGPKPTRAATQRCRTMFQFVRHRDELRAAVKKSFANRAAVCAMRGNPRTRTIRGCTKARRGRLRPSSAIEIPT